VHILPAITLLISFFILPCTGLIEKAAAQQQPATDTKDDLQPVSSNQVETINNKLKVIEEQIKKSIEDENEVTAQQLGVSVSELQKRTEILLEIQNTYKQHLEALQRQTEYRVKQEELKAAQKTKYTKEPPYSLNLYENHLVELSKSIQDTETAKQAVELSKKLLEDAEASLQDVNQRIALVQEKQEIEKDETQALKLKWDVEENKLKKQLAEAIVDLQKTNLENAARYYELTQMTVEAKRSQSDWIKNNLHFDKEDLANQIKFINNRKDELLSKISEFKKRQKQAEKVLIDNKKRLYRVKSDEEYSYTTEVIKASELWNNAYKIKIEQSEALIQLLVQQEKIWRQRYEIIRRDIDYEDLKTIQQEANTQLDTIVRTISLAQDNQIQLQLQIEEIENKLAQQPEQSSLAKALKDQKEALLEMAEHGFQYMTVLQSTKKMYKRFFDEIELKRVEADLQKKIIVFLKNTINVTVFSNTILDYIIALLTFLIGIFIAKLLKRFFFNRLLQWVARTNQCIDDCLVRIIEKMAIPVLYFGTFYISLRSLTLNPVFSKFLNVLGITILTFYVVRFLISLITYLLNEYWLKKEAHIRYESSIRALFPIIKVVFWGIGLFFLLDNLGFKISTVIASLGIGGIAIALASQNILGDLFNYFVILFDRPFEIGDFIIINEHMGSIENIGIKTTRIRSLSGEQLIFANTDLTGSRVRNFKRMMQRRVLFNLGITYQTSLEHLKEIPGIITKIIKDIDDTIFDRAHFFSFGDFSLNFEVVYYIIGNDYIKYMDIQQQINLSIKESFEKRGIEFAYPTQMLYLQTIEPTKESEQKVII